MCPAPALAALICTRLPQYAGRGHTHLGRAAPLCDYPYKRAIKRFALPQCVRTPSALQSRAGAKREARRGPCPCAHLRRAGGFKTKPLAEAVAAAAAAAAQLARLPNPGLGSAAAGHGRSRCVTHILVPLVSIQNLFGAGVAPGETAGAAGEAAAALLRQAPSLHGGRAPRARATPAGPRRPRPRPRGRSCRACRWVRPTAPAHAGLSQAEGGDTISTRVLLAGHLSRC